MHKVINLAAIDEIPEALALVGFFADIAEHGEKVGGPQVAGRARHLAFGWGQCFQQAGPLGKKLKSGRKTHAIFRRQVLFRQFRSVEIGDLARANYV